MRNQLCRTKKSTSVLLFVSLLSTAALAITLQVTFAYATGPLAWSVVAFRNSLVFHSLDKVRY